MSRQEVFVDIEKLKQVIDELEMAAITQGAPPGKPFRSRNELCKAVAATDWGQAIGVSPQVLALRIARYNVPCRTTVRERGMVTVTGPVEYVPVEPTPRQSQAPRHSVYQGIDLDDFLEPFLERGINVDGLKSILTSEIHSDPENLKIRAAWTALRVKFKIPPVKKKIKVPVSTSGLVVESILPLDQVRLPGEPLEVFPQEPASDGNFLPPYDETPWANGDTDAAEAPLDVEWDLSSEMPAEAVTDVGEVPADVDWDLLSEVPVDAVTDVGEALADAEWDFSSEVPAEEDTDVVEALVDDEYWPTEESSGQVPSVDEASAEIANDDEFTTYIPSVDELLEEDLQHAVEESVDMTSTESLPTMEEWLTDPIPPYEPVDGTGEAPVEAVDEDEYLPLGDSWEEDVNPDDEDLQPYHEGEEEEGAQ